MFKKPIIASIFILYCFGIYQCSRNKPHNPPSIEYESINKKFNAKSKLVRSRKEPIENTEKKKAQLKKLLKNLPDYPSNDNLELLRGKIFSDLGKFNQALTIYENLIRKKSHRATDAKFEKVRVFLELKKYELAGQIFQEIEKKVFRDENYFKAVYQFAIHLKDLEKRWIFSYQFLNAAMEKTYLHPCVGIIYTNLADIERERFDKKKGIQFLQKVLQQPLNPDTRRTILCYIKPLQMIHSPAPPVKAHAWLNTEPLELDELSDRITVIDFWSPGCFPCREMFPKLIDLFHHYQHQDIQLIGIVQITRRYSDDIYHKILVSPEEYIKLTRSFLKRHQVNFPIAMVKGNKILDDFGVMGFPTLFLLDKNGKIRDFKLGAENPEAFEQKIKNLILEKLKK